MTAEEKLKELYKQQEPMEGEFIDDGTRIVMFTVERISAEDIDLIANLVVERLKNDANY